MFIYKLMIEWVGWCDTKLNSILWWSTIHYCFAPLATIIIIFICVIDTRQNDLVWGWVMLFCKVYCHWSICELDLTSLIEVIIYFYIFIDIIFYNIELFAFVYGLSSASICKYFTQILIYYHFNVIVIYNRYECYQLLTSNLWTIATSYHRRSWYNMWTDFKRQRWSLI